MRSFFVYESIKPNKTEELSTFVSDKIRILGELFVVPHTSEDLEIKIQNINGQLQFENKEKFFTPQQISDWDHLLAERHQFSSFTSASNFYLPPHLPNFTYTGYDFYPLNGFF